MLSFPLLGRSRSWAAPAWLSLLSLLTLSLLCAAPIQAQQYPGGGSGGGYPGGGADSYSVVYSGGSTTVTTANYPPNPPVTNTTPYSASTSTNAPGAWGGGAFTYINGGGGSGSVTCKDKITATFTWNGGPNNDPPPTSAIVTETANVAWGGPGSSGDCGLPNPTTPASQPPNLTATRYTVNSGGSSFSVHCTPTASMSGTSPQPYHVMGGSAYVGYTASASPVAIKLTGPTPDSSGNLNILIGQGCTGHLSASGFTLSNYQWTPGPVFDQFLIASDQSQGYATFLSAAALAQPNPIWHYLLDSGAGTFRVTCSATASINGTSLGTVTGRDSVKVWVPPYSCYGVSGPTGIYGRNVSTGNGDMSGGSSSVPGMLFNASVKTPDMFINPASSNAVGYSLFVQIIDTNHTQWYYFSPTPLKSGSQGPALDNEWPYAPGSPADGTPILATDSPNLILNDGVNEFAIADDYEMYLMYCPPGNDSQYVPLHKVGWSWDAGPVMQNFGFGAWPAGAAGTVSINWDARWTEHPSWAKLYIKQ